MRAKLEQRDRVSFSLGASAKAFGTGFDVHVSYSTDVQDGESLKHALQRATKFVEREVQRQGKVYGPWRTYDEARREG